MLLKLKIHSFSDNISSKCLYSSYLTNKGFSSSKYEIGLGLLFQETHTIFTILQICPDLSQYFLIQGQLFSQAETVDNDTALNTAIANIFFIFN
jgi:hypothetical protein